MGMCRRAGKFYPGVNALPASAVPQSDDNLCAPPVDTSLSSGTPVVRNPGQDLLGLHRAGPQGLSHRGCGGEPERCSDVILVREVHFCQAQLLRLLFSDDLKPPCKVQQALSLLNVSCP